MKNLSFLLFLMLFSSILAQEKRVNEEKSKIEFTFIDKDLKGSLDGFTFSGKINLSDLPFADPGNQNWNLLSRVIRA